MQRLMRRRRPFVCLSACLLVAGLATCTDSPTTTADAVITVEPADQSVVAGATATFAVTASNATSYKWQSRTGLAAPFVDIAGASSPGYTTPATVLADHGKLFRVIAIGANNADTSASAMLSVTSAAVAPVITAHPVAQVVTAGSDATFSVTATGTSLTYQWQWSIDGGTSFTNLASETSPTLIRGVVTLAASGLQFRVVVTNAVGSVTSNPALLTVTPAPVAPAFTTQPDDQNILAPATATFTAAASGVPAPTLQWQVSTGAAFTSIPGATGNAYTTAATSGADDGRMFRAVATNASGSVVSNTATLTVTVPVAPVFTQHPQDVVIIEDQNAQMTVTVTGIPTPTLQWQVSAAGSALWNDIPGATAATISLPNTLSVDGNKYRVIATNGVGTPVASNVATLTVTAAAPPLSIVTTSPLPDATTNLPYTATFSAAGGSLPYTWSMVAGPQAGWTLDPTTGLLSGTPVSEGSARWTVRVTDSSNPPQTAQKDFDITIQFQCDRGFGFASVANAPPTVEGRFCPGSFNPPGDPSGGQVSAVWFEQYPYGNGSYFESLAVNYNGLTGELLAVSFHLSDPTRTITYLCLPVGDANHPSCTGVTFNLGSGVIRFENTLVSSGSSPGYILNGELFMH
ncbi:MAG TPA: putative Ig domain-containing protein [Longimicrobiales bacterium]